MARRSGPTLTTLAASAPVLPATAAAQDQAPRPSVPPPPAGGTLTLAAERVGRVALADAIPIFRRLSVGDVVDVYR
jgi:hypothetical protein